MGVPFLLVSEQARQVTVQQPARGVNKISMFFPKKTESHRKYNEVSVSLFKKIETGKSYTLIMKFSNPIWQFRTCRRSDEVEARESIKVLIKTGMISFNVFGVFATTVFHT